MGDKTKIDWDINSTLAKLGSGLRGILERLGIGAHESLADSAIGGERPKPVAEVGPQITIPESLVRQYRAYAIWCGKEPEPLSAWDRATLTGIEQRFLERFAPVREQLVSALRSVNIVIVDDNPWARIQTRLGLGQIKSDELGGSAADSIVGEYSSAETVIHDCLDRLTFDKPTLFVLDGDFDYNIIDFPDADSACQVVLDEIAQRTLSDVYAIIRSGSASSMLGDSRYWHPFVLGFLSKGGSDVLDDIVFQGALLSRPAVVERLIGIVNQWRMGGGVDSTHNE